VGEGAIGAPPFECCRAGSKREGGSEKSEGGCIWSTLPLVVVAPVSKAKGGGVETVMGRLETKISPILHIARTIATLSCCLWSQKRGWGSNTSVRVQKTPPIAFEAIEGREGGLGVERVSGGWNEWVWVAKRGWGLNASGTSPKRPLQSLLKRLRGGRWVWGANE
jgi:hypothetical protein